ncbi:MAG TPA: DUF2332 domain-containing protein [Acidimicrobiales bacterium]|nr:DUF2332 domain-containing protein [Acidimicrobiales bacterium]
MPTPRQMSLPEVLTHQRRACARIGSEMYAEIIDVVAADLAADGPCARLLRPHEDDPFGSALVLRFLGAVHWLVLAGRAPALAAHYPTAGGTPGPGLARDFVAAVEALSAEIDERLPLPVQTNEVGRSAVLVGGYVTAARRGGGRPLRVLEVGSSAGLNLRWDRYWYDTGATTFGDPASPLRFVGRWAGTPPRLDGGDAGVDVTVVERAGCDRSPIDVGTDEGRRLVRSYVWPDQAGRHARLDAALAVAADAPVPLERADLGDWLTERLTTPVPGTTTVVAHSIVWQYVGESSRRAMRAALAAAGEAATPDAPVAWLRMEPAGAVADLRLTWWPGGDERVLAYAEYQGDTVWWGRARPAVS